MTDTLETLVERLAKLEQAVVGLMLENGRLHKEMNSLAASVQTKVDKAINNYDRLNRQRVVEVRDALSFVRNELNIHVQSKKFRDSVSDA